MAMRLTPPDSHDQRWSPDRTVRVVPRYENSAMASDLRNKATGYTVYNTLDQNTTQVRNLRQAQAAANDILAAQPRLAWGDWWRRDLFVMACSAVSPIGHIGAFIRLQEDREHRGLWEVWFNIVAPDTGRNSHFRWLSDIRYIPHRMAHIRAAAEHRVFELTAREEITT